MSRHPLYAVRTTMRARCNNPREKSFSNYGGRGIKVCNRWKDFKCFLADMGERPSPEYSIDRINNDLGYEPGNCRWATRKQQARNKRNSSLITAFGRTQSLAAWAEETWLDRCLIRDRLRLSWSPEDALSREPLNGIRPECKHGHLLSGENLYIDPDGRRHCRACNRASVAKRRIRLTTGEPA